MEKAEKILLYDFGGEESLPEEFREELRERAQNFEVVEAEGDYQGKISREDLKDVEVFISRVFDHYAESLFRDSDLKYVGVMATAQSHYPLELLESEDIRIENVPGYATESVAELTVNMMLHLSLRNHRTTDFVESGNWSVGPFPGNELKDKKLGVIGLGRIGERVAEIAEAFGMEINYYSRSQKEFAAERGWKYSELEELLETSDIVSIHCSLNDDTRNLLNTEKLELLKEGAVLLNAAREEVQDVEKTVELCREGRIQAWFDALEEGEKREKILETGNAVLTSHSGCATEEAQERLRRKTLEKLENYLENR